VNRRATHRLIAGVAAGLLCCAGAAGALATATADPQTRSVGMVILYGNPSTTAAGSTTTPVTPPAYPVDGIPVQPPRSLPPRGSNPNTHVYVNAQNGSTSAFGALGLSFRDLRGATVTSLMLVIKDDPGTGTQLQLNNTGDTENVMADTAVLAACPLTQAPAPDQPDATVTYACPSSPILGRRVVNPADGVGTWTFDLTSLGAQLTAPGNPGIGIVPQASGMQTYSVAFLDGSAALPYTTVGGSQPGALPPLPATLTGDRSPRPQPSAATTRARARARASASASASASKPSRPAATGSPLAPTSGPLPTATSAAVARVPAPAAIAHGPASVTSLAEPASPPGQVPPAVDAPRLTLADPAAAGVDPVAFPVNTRSVPFHLPVLLLLLLPLIAGLLAAYGDRLPLRLTTVRPGSGNAALPDAPAGGARS